MARRRDVAVAAAVVLLPLAVLVVRVALDGAPSPAGDVGLIEVRVRDVGLGGNLPLLGSYSRFGFNQPGPLLLYLFAPFYRLAGGRFWGIEVGALVLQGAPLVLVLGVARRRASRLGLAGATAVLAVFVHGLGPRWLADPWEPHVLVPAALALLVVAFDAVAGRVWALPLAAALAVAVGQPYASMLPFAAAMGAWATAGVAWHAWRGGPDRNRDRDRRRGAVLASVVAVGIVAVLWAPPIVEQLTRRPGNLARMADTLGGDDPKLGFADGWRTVALELSAAATWFGRPQRLAGLTGAVDLSVAPAVPVGAVALAVAGAVAAVRRRTTALLLCATTLVGLLAATFAMSRLIGPVFAWIPQWLRLIGVATVLSVGAVVLTSVPRRPALERVAIALLGAAAVGASVLTVTDAVGAWREPDPVRDAVLRLAVAGADAVRARSTDDRPVLARSRVDSPQLFGGEDVAPEVLVLVLEKRGIDTVVDAALANKFGPRRAQPRPARLELRIVDAAAPPPPGFTTVATADPMGAAGRARRRRILEAAGLAGDASDATVTRAIAADPTLRRRLLALRDLPARPRLALVLGPAGS